MMGQRSNPRHPLSTVHLLNVSSHQIKAFSSETSHVLNVEEQGIRTSSFGSFSHTETVMASLRATGPGPKEAHSIWVSNLIFTKHRTLGIRFSPTHGVAMVFNQSHETGGKFSRLQGLRAMPQTLLQHIL